MRKIIERPLRVDLNIITCYAASVVTSADIQSDGVRDDIGTGMHKLSVQLRGLIRTPLRRLGSVLSASFVAGRKPESLFVDRREMAKSSKTARDCDLSNCQ